MPFRPVPGRSFVNMVPRVKRVVGLGAIAGKTLAYQPGINWPLRLADEGQSLSCFNTSVLSVPTLEEARTALINAHYG